MIAAAAIVVAVWCVLASLVACLPGCAFALGRFRARQRHSYTNLVVSRPPVPEPVAIDIPADADGAEVERLVYDAWFRAIVAPEFPQYREFGNAA